MSPKSNSPKVDAQPKEYGREKEFMNEFSI